MRTGLALLCGPVAVWIVLLVVLWRRSRDRVGLTVVMRMLPDVVRLVGGLARDRTISRSARWPVWFLIAYLASPIDLVPDFIPVIGYADDALLVSLVLQRLVRRAPPDALARHWPGSAEGLDALRRVLRLTSAPR